jgi:Lysyl oxidase
MLAQALPVLLVIGLLTSGSVNSQTDTSPYPDLRSLPPTHLLLDTAEVEGVAHHVLRFSTIIGNVGPGRLELRGASTARRTIVSQRILGDAGQVTELPVGEFVFHPAHNHWHFEHFADYELWTRAAFEAWLASGRSVGQPGWRGSKTTGQAESFCVRDSLQVEALAEGSGGPVYEDCGRDLQGISVGWADAYPFSLPEQWIDLGDTPLPDGEYVLRVIADPLNLIYESPGRSDPERESPEANEAVLALVVRNGCAEEGAVTETVSQYVCGDAED